MSVFGGVDFLVQNHAPFANQCAVMSTCGHVAGATPARLDRWKMLVHGGLRRVGTQWTNLQILHGPSCVTWHGFFTDQH